MQVAVFFGNWMCLMRHIVISSVVTVNKIADVVVINNHARCSTNLYTVLKPQIVVECQLLALLDCTSMKNAAVQ
jgi:hypothetical protein